MVLASHVIISAYGFWLPNDPRGSWSEFVAAWELFRYGGKATKVKTTESVAHVKHDRAKRIGAKRLLNREPVIFDGHQALAIARGFAKAAEESGYEILACAILPDHVHLIISRIHRSITQVAGHLKARATRQLREEGLHPFEGIIDRDGSLPTCWAGKSWKVFIDNRDHLAAAIRYVENNPLKEGKKLQNWSFVKRRDAGTRGPRAAAK